METRNRYEILGLAELQTENLQPHPLYRKSRNHSNILGYSIARVGVLKPLIVLEDRKSVLDGCMRLKLARANGIASLKCLIVKADVTSSLINNLNIQDMMG